MRDEIKTIVQAAFNRKAVTQNTDGSLDVSITNDEMTILDLEIATWPVESAEGLWTMDGVGLHFQPVAKADAPVKPKRSRAKAATVAPETAEAVEAPEADEAPARKKPNYKRKPTEPRTTVVYPTKTTSSKPATRMAEKPAPTKSVRASTAAKKVAKREAEAAVPPKHGLDLALWVGYASYPTIEDFVVESQERGVCRRISRVPKGITPGKTRLFLIHDEGVKGDAVIFGYCTIDHVEMLVEDTDVEPGFEDGTTLPDFVYLVDLREAEQEERRHCGFRTDEGAVYACSSTIEKAEGRQIIDQSVLGTLTVFETPLDYNAIIDENGTRFRSFRHVDGDKILEHDGVTVKAAPSARLTDTVEVPMALKARASWTAAERDALFAMAEQYGPYQACKRFASVTVRTFQSCMYQYQMHRKEYAARAEQEERTAKAMAAPVAKKARKPRKAAASA